MEYAANTMNDINSINNTNAQDASTDNANDSVGNTSNAATLTSGNEHDLDEESDYTRLGFSHASVEEAYINLMLSLSYLSPSQQQEVKDACHFADKAHILDKRKSGEPYITHPIAVAEILAGCFRVNRDSIIAAILHDTVEDTEVTLDELSERYGKVVSRLVDGVTKLKSASYNKKQNKAATFHKILVATLNDPRVLMIKLADRLHNMSTLDAVKPEKQRSTAQETLGFYIPFARVMGLNDIADHIEILCYRNLDVDQYNKLSDKLLQHGLGRNYKKNMIQSYLQRRLHRMEIPGNVRVIDHKVALFRQFFANRGNVNSLMRHYEFEIVLESIEDCKRLSNYFIDRYDIPTVNVADNISHPLPGGNQSLTLTYVRDHDTIKVTLLTTDMMSIARLGVVGADNASAVSQSVIQASLRNLEDLISESHYQSGDEIMAAEFTTEKLMQYLHQRKIVCYSPMGKAYELPRGATALDFAYAVGPTVGRVAVTAIIDSQSANLATVLIEGQTVEIITDENAVPKAEWLGFAVTNKARDEILRWLHSLPNEDKQQQGKQALDRALQTYDKQLTDLTSDNWDNLLQWRSLDSQQALFLQISSGDLLPQLVVSRLFSDEVECKSSQVHTQKRQHLLANISGVEVSFSRCCNPVYGDPILAHNSSSNGLVVHRHKCYDLDEIRKNFPSRIFKINWRKDWLEASETDVPYSEHVYFQSCLKVESIILSDEQISDSIRVLRGLEIGVEFIDNDDTECIFHILVKSRKQIDEGIEALRNLLGFPNIRRLYQF